MARTMGTWLSGPSSEPASGYPGERLGLPQQGPGSIARFGRRVGAILADWLISLGLTAVLAVSFGLMSRDDLLYSMDFRNIALLVWLVIGVAAVRLFGFTPGQYLLGLAVIPLDGRDHVGLGRALIRNLLIVLVIPALFTDEDHRGLHDLASKTAVVRR
ncbi:RDD family protein [Mycolicibacterium peregrinum]|uniref:RDD family protein n=1 Tax=Mycolicibacterium peregrinum TaxID=43304 RepID=A0A4Z0HPJ1_MYCPR|nr:RDD family protein [Mycolicibacterium peregrinum]TGB38470.1 RDD family protein [Mycolicibacterium peregrinum]TGB38596.1 RDD family protein [Mycolicibacterium peregrinum]